MLKWSFFARITHIEAFEKTMLTMNSKSESEKYGQAEFE